MTKNCFVQNLFTHSKTLFCTKINFSGGAEPALGLLSLDTVMYDTTALVTLQ